MEELDAGRPKKPFGGLLGAETKQISLGPVFSVRVVMENMVKHTLLFCIILKKTYNYSPTCVKQAAMG